MTTRTSLGWLLAAALTSTGIGCGGSDSEPSNGSTDTGTDTGTGAGSTTGTTTGSGGSTGSGGQGAGGKGMGGAPSFEGYTRVDQGAGIAVPGGADIAIAPGGTIYASWVVEQAGGRDVFVAASTDGGKTFGAGVQVDDAATIPLVSMARHPYVAADDARVAVVFNDQPGVVRLYVSPAGGALAFGAPIVVGSDVDTQFRDFPKPLFLPDGTIAVAYQGYPATGARIFVSRESAGWTSEAASAGAPGVPCECCPLDFVVTGGGGVMTAFRNNDSNTREMWMAAGSTPAAFTSWSAISSSEGYLDACPMQGPRLGQTGASSHVAVWSGRGASAGQVHFASSADDGASWSGGADIGLGGDEPTLAVAPSGRIFVTAVTGSDQSVLTWSDDGGQTFAPAEALSSPDGDIDTPQAEGASGVAALVGVSAQQTVWLRRME